jgi:antitoxin component YwqK of YwqJK toxin-antitoxin module
MEGPFEKYYESGKLQSESTYKNDKLEGPAKSYYESGTLKSEVTFKNGELEGPIKEYYESGEIVIKTYEDGKFISKKEYDKQGNLIKEK